MKKIISQKEPKSFQETTGQRANGHCFKEDIVGGVTVIHNKHLGGTLEVEQSRQNSKSSESTLGGSKLEGNRS
jgi:hypothetical protein